jgi:ferredoxin
VGWYTLLTCFAETGQLPELVCPQGDCSLRGEADAALARLAFLRTAVTGGSEALPPVQVPDLPRAPRQAELAAAMRRLESALAAEARQAIWPQLGWTPRIEGPCTLCSGCVNTCPTQVFSIEERVGTTVLRADAELCTGCGACARICPEEVLDISPAIFSELTGPRDVFTAQKALCKGCGMPYEAPTFVAALRQRMAAAGFGGVLVDRLDYCPECRAALPAKPAQEPGRNG